MIGQYVLFRMENDNVFNLHVLTDSIILLIIYNGYKKAQPQKGTTKQNKYLLLIETYCDKLNYMLHLIIDHHNNPNVNFGLMDNLRIYTGKLIKRLNMILKIEPRFFSTRIGMYISMMYQIFNNLDIFEGP